MEYVITTLREEVPVQQIITLYFFEVDRNFRFDGESHDFWELNYVDSGELLSYVDGEYKPLRQGDIVFYPPNQFHTHHCNGQDPANLIVLTFICHSEVLNTLGNRILHLNDQQAGCLRNIITEAQNAFSSPLDIYITCELIRRHEQTFAAEQLIRLNLEFLLIDLLRNNAFPSTTVLRTTIKALSDNDKVDRIIAFLNDNLYKRISLQDVCDYTTLSATNVKTIFKRVTGRPIMSYYTDLKITEAKRLLRKGFYPVNEIADMLAYTSVQYFSKQFRKETGMTPTEYAASVKARAGFH